MDSKNMPYNNLIVIGSTLYSTRGSYIDIINISDGRLLSTWKCPSTHSPQNTDVTKVEPTLNMTESARGKPEAENFQPVKRRKLSNFEDCKVATISKPEKKRKKNNHDAIYSIDTPNISVFTASANGKFLVLVTGEDKSIRVLEIIETGQSITLNQLSQRSMPKRPCGLVVTKDDSTIIIADKFGDVYSLPLLYSCPSPTTASVTHEIANPPEIFMSAANELTIHSKRNLRALECQRKQKKLTPQKPAIDFDHKLLLGHVSMVTDIKLAYSNERGYLITSDRDEHIRVSRGIPQTHIIENFCLGHSEFVSRLCIPGSRAKILVSGGGDDEVFVWDWKSGTLLSKTNVADHVTNFRKKLHSEIKDISIFNPRLRVAISGILHICEVDGNQSLDIIVICCESVPALFTFILSQEDTLQYIETILVSGNVLAMCVTSDLSSTSSNLFVSIDHIHELGSKSDIRKFNALALSPLYKVSLKCGHLVGSPVAIKTPVNDNKEDMNLITDKLSDLLYNVENLRKGGDESSEN